MRLFWIISNFISSIRLLRSLLLPRYQRYVGHAIFCYNAWVGRMSTLELDSSPSEGRSLEEAILGFDADANASFGTKPTQDEISSKSLFIWVKSLKELVSLFLNRFWETTVETYETCFIIPTSYMTCIPNCIMKR